MASSSRWQSATSTRGGNGIGRLAVFLFAMSVVQLLVGAHLRHSLPTWLPVFFMSLVHTHLLLATLIFLAVLSCSVFVRCGSNRVFRELRTPANTLLAIVFVQILLGFATWIANYATPWVELTPWLARYTVQGKGFWESMIVTGHQATGSLLIVCSLWLACRAYRRVLLSKPVRSLEINEQKFVPSNHQSKAASIGLE